jgi:radical SAM superfamily enzyme YgiQ (UPF0313 family)
MKILLISPGRGPNIKQQKSVMMPQLALDLLAGLTPPEHAVTIVEEEYNAIDLDADCDLVGLSCMTSNAPRGYELAREFRKRGKTVVMGGVHPTILPNEALGHADAVVIGEAEGVWPRLLEDFAHGRMRKTYHEPHPPLDVYVPVKPRKGMKKGLFHVVPVMTTRGCPYNCDFCCVHDIYGAKVRHVAIENIVRHIVDSRGKFFMFLDDNIMGEPRYSKELFRAIAPLGIKWVGQASLSFVEDGELLRLARESGCAALFFGLESVSEERLAKMRKSIHKIEKLEEAIGKLRGAGIYPYASVVFGFDEDTPRTFPETLEFMKRNGVGSASINVLTPYPGTEIHRQLKAEGRIFTDDWRYYNHNTVVFRPKNLSLPELLAGRIWARNEFTKTSAVLRRLAANRAHPLLHLAINRASWRSSRKQIRNFPNAVAELCRMESRARGEEESRGPEQFRFEDFIPGTGKA